MKSIRRVGYAIPILCILLSIRFPVVGHALPLFCILATLLPYVLCEQICGYPKEHPKGKTFRRMILLGISICILFGIIAYGVNNDRLLKKEGDMFTGILYSLFLLTYGNVSPKLPYNQTVGLRLPWTLQNERVWRYAHRMSGICAFPAAFLCFGGVLLQLPSMYPIALLTWVLIPSVLSFLYAQKQGGNENE